MESVRGLKLYLCQLLLSHSRKATYETDGHVRRWEKELNLPRSSLSPPILAPSPLPLLLLSLSFQIPSLFSLLFAAASATHHPIRSVDK